ncbi:MAG: GxxExxY protein [Bacteroidota bacterium]
MENENKFPLKVETYDIIGIAMEVHKILGRGFLEIVYKDALEYEFQQRKILYAREREYKVQYKDIILRHTYNADFVVFDKIILEVKAQNGIEEDHFRQSINYLAVSKCKVGLVLNFGEPSLVYKRVIL